MMNKFDIFANEYAQARVLVAHAEVSGTSEDWDKMLACSNLWSVRHDDINDYSVMHMNDEELQQTIIEDLLLVYQYANHGAYGVYPTSQLKRFLGEVADIMNSRIDNALKSVIEEDFVIQMTDKLSINPEQLEAAQEFSGFYIDENPENGHDIFQSLLMTGGTPLLSETIEELSHQINKSLDIDRK